MLAIPTTTTTTSKAIGASIGQRITLRLPRLHAAQEKIKRERARFNVIDCGRRFGKDVLERDLLVETALAGKPVAWFEPSFPMMVEVWPELISLLRPLIVDKDESEHRIQLVTGGVVKLWSLASEDAYNNARGKKYARVIVNEAAKAGRLRKAWQEVIRPTLTDYRGDAYFGSTPNGHDFFFELFTWGGAPDRADWRSWQMPTAANPYIDPTEIEAARRDLPEAVFRQEYLADFLDNAGQVFRRVRSCVYSEPAPEPPSAETKPEELRPYILAVDWARSNDFTWLTVMDMRTKRVVEIDRFNQIDFAYQRERLKSLYYKWRCELVVAEANSIGQPNIEALVADNIPVYPFTTTNASKATIIERLILAIENGTVSYPDDPVLIGELESFEMSRTKLGAVTYSAPEGQHDDGVISLALALWGCQ